MHVRFKRAVVSAVILYALIFLIASGLMFNIKLIEEVTFGSVMIVVVAALTYVITKYYYFKGIRIESPIKDGLSLGIVLTIIVVAIEIPIMVYGFAAAKGWGYFLTWHIILGYALMTIIPVLSAYRAK